MLKVDNYRVQQLGLVLKNFFPEQTKLAVLTRNFGRLDLVIANNLANKLAISKISYGMLIAYNTVDNTASVLNLLSSGAKVKISKIELIYVPIILPDQLMFWHQLLELIFYTVPIGLHIPTLFEQICLVGANLDLFSDSGQKLLALCRMLNLLGLCPTNYSNFTPEFRALIYLPIDISVHQKIDLKWEEALSRWWRTSMIVHPKVNLFKTIAY